VLGGCSLRGGEGTILGIIIGSTIMKVIENGINMFKISYTNAAGEPHEWRLDTNWRYIIIGGVILLAVVLDQLMHILEERQRKKGA
jgi:ribose transport system permease protein